MICAHAQMFTNNHIPYSNSCTLFLLFTQQPCQIIARRIKISSISLVYRILYLFIYLPDLITRAEAVTPISA